MKPGMDLGSTLRIAREQAGLTREQYAEHLRIPVGEIAAFENNHFEQIRDEIYAEGVLRAYARELGLDPRPLVHELRSTFDQGTETDFDLQSLALSSREQFPPSPGRGGESPQGKGRHRSAAAFLAFFIAASMAAGAYLYEKRRTASTPAAGIDEHDNRTAGKSAVPTAVLADTTVGTPTTDTTVGMPTTDADLTGRWTLRTRVDSTRVAAFEGLRLGYELDLEQTGTAVRGRGYKVTENGRRTRGRGRTPITVEGELSEDQLTLSFTERGLRRQSGGTLVLTHDGGDSLRGRFSSDAAASSGIAEASRQ